ncbi:MAG TPA: BREX-2 system adenine-specific DNA-methyltransferase PglX, partial [Kofleriaceae bacterium]|nr:BREX-2 system adenine-specific DNA-methyltransferase PglX [Kofleriaceae bacterium]
VLASIDLQLVVDTSQAFIPHHGTPTVMLFAQNRTPKADVVRAVMGKRGEPGTPNDPSKGKVWTSIVEGLGTVGYNGEFVSVAEIARDTFSKHPWSLGGGGMAELRSSLEGQAIQRVGDDTDVGVICMTRADDIYVGTRSELKRRAIHAPFARCFPLGNSVRDWALSSTSEFAVFPYDDELRPARGQTAPSVHRFLWPYRTILWERREPNGNHHEIGLTWWEWSRLIRRRLEGPVTIAFAKIATSNHFVLSRGDALFSDGTPVIKLPAEASEDDHLALLGLLNSSTAGFWMKQVFHCKGSQGVNEGSKAELWEQFFEFDATKLKLFPIPEGHGGVVPWARELDRIARRRAERSVAAVLAHDGWRDTAALRARLDERRTADLADLQHMIALQEELDWECYRLYGIDDSPAALPPEKLTPMPSNWRPVEIELATRDAETRAAIARGDDSTEIPTAWFERHRWEPLTEVPSDAPKAVRDRVAARRARLAGNAELRLMEQPTYKRRWYHPDYDAEERVALATWLADRIEAVVADRKGKPATLSQMTSTLEEDPRVHAVGELLAGRRDYQLSELVADA